jgi:hypothetical protein
MDAREDGAAFATARCVVRNAVESPALYERARQLVASCVEAEMTTRARLFSAHVDYGAARLLTRRKCSQRRPPRTLLDAQCCEQAPRLGGGGDCCEQRLGAAAAAAAAASGIRVIWRARPLVRLTSARVCSRRSSCVPRAR